MFFVVNCCMHRIKYVASARDTSCYWDVFNTDGLVYVEWLIFKSQLMRLKFKWSMDDSSMLTTSSPLSSTFRILFEFLSGNLFKSPVPVP